MSHTPAPSIRTDATPTDAGGTEIPLSWDELRAVVTATGDGLYLATVGADGRPHVTYVSAGWADERLWISVFDKSRKAANLRTRPEVAITCPPSLELNLLIRDAPRHRCRRSSAALGCRCAPLRPRHVLRRPGGPQPAICRAAADDGLDSPARPRPHPPLATHLSTACRRAAELATGRHGCVAHGTQTGHEPAIVRTRSERQRATGRHGPAWPMERRPGTNHAIVRDAERAPASDRSTRACVAHGTL